MTEFNEKLMQACLDDLNHQAAILRLAARAVVALHSLQRIDGGHPDVPFMECNHGMCPEARRLGLVAPSRPRADGMDEFLAAERGHLGRILGRIRVLRVLRAQKGEC